MSNDATILLHLSIGLTLAFSAINLMIGFQKKSDPAYLSLGGIGICVSIYLGSIFFIEGFHLDSLAYYLGMFFFLTNFAILPWFFCFYTGYCNYKLQVSYSAGFAITYLLLVFTGEFMGFKIWNVFGHIVLVSIIVFGFKGAFFQYKNNDKVGSLWLSGALIIFSLLTLDDIVRMHFNQFYPFNMPKNLLPFDYFLILFMIIMSLKLTKDMQHKYKLEKMVNAHQKRWSHLLDSINLLVLGSNKDGMIDYANPFYFKITGMEESEILGKHFSILLSKNEKDQLNNIGLGKNRIEQFQNYQNTTYTKTGESKRISWTAVGLYDEDNSLISSISIGTDITEKENALHEINELKSKLENENILLKAELDSKPQAENITGDSDAIRYVLKRALQVAPTDTTVLIEGETGVGKELITLFIQKNSLRKRKPFVKVNCSTIPAALIESELFGFEKGAFTGADRNKKGLVEMANGGTLFLDEIGEFPMELQPKLLRFLQEGEFVPLGSENVRKVDVRIIAATNKELIKEIDAGNFRNDLYYRLYVYPITVPPLRNRTEDIPDLTDGFIKIYAQRHGKKISKISKKVLEGLTNYSWPGNIRELENVIERAVIVATSDTIKDKDLMPVLNQDNKAQEVESNLLSMVEMEKKHITDALKIASWKIHGPGGAAEILQINPNTLRSRIKKLDIRK